MMKPRIQISIPKSMAPLSSAVPTTTTADEELAHARIEESKNMIESNKKSSKDDNDRKTALLLARPAAAATAKAEPLVVPATPTTTTTTTPSTSIATKKSFPINDECTSLAVYAEQFIIGGFADGTVRIFDIYGKFPPPPPSLKNVAAADVCMDDDHNTTTSNMRPKKNLVNSNTYQAFGAVMGQIRARGVHTNVRLDVKVCDSYCFASVVRGSMECIAIDLSSLLKPPPEQDGGDRTTTTAVNILDDLVVYRHWDAKVRGLGACTKLPSTTNTTNDNRYLLMTGKSIKNLHIWSFTPPPPSSNDETTAAASWQCLYDTATNGTTIQWISSVLLVQRSTSQDELYVCTKSEGQCVRVWDLSHELLSSSSAAVTTSTTNKRPRPLYRDVPGTDRALAVTDDWHVYSTGVFDPGHVQVQDFSSFLSSSSSLAKNNEIREERRGGSTISHISLPTGTSAAAARQRHYHTIDRVEIRHEKSTSGGGQRQLLAQVSDGSVWYYQYNYDDDKNGLGGGVRRINDDSALSSPATASHLSNSYGVFAGRHAIQCIPLVATTMTLIRPEAIVSANMEKNMTIAASSDISTPTETSKTIEPEGAMSSLATTAPVEERASPTVIERVAAATARTTVIGSRPAPPPPPPLDNDIADEDLNSDAPKKNKRPRILLKNILNAVLVPTVCANATPTSRLRPSGTVPMDIADYVAVVTDCGKKSRRHSCPSSPTDHGTDTDTRMVVADEKSGKLATGAVVVQTPMVFRKPMVSSNNNNNNKTNGEPRSSDTRMADEGSQVADRVVQTPLVFRKQMVSSNNKTTNEHRNERGGSSSSSSEKKNHDSSTSRPVTAISPAIPRKRQRPTTLCTPRKLEPQSLDAGAAVFAATNTTVAPAKQKDSGPDVAPTHRSSGQKTLAVSQIDANHGSIGSHKPGSKETKSARKPTLSASSSSLSAADRKRLMRRRACRGQMQRIDQIVRQMTAQQPRSELNYMKSRILLAVRRVIQDLHWDGTATIASGRQRLEHEILPAFRANVLLPLLRRHELETQQPAADFDDASFFVEAVAYVDALEQPSH